MPLEVIEIDEITHIVPSDIFQWGLSFPYLKLKGRANITYQLLFQTFDIFNQGKAAPDDLRQRSRNNNQKCSLRTKERF